MFDYLSLDEKLDEEARMVRDTAREFVRDRVVPVVDDYYREARFPADLFEEMAELGFFGASLDGYGLPDLSDTAYGVLMRELGAGDSGIRSIVAVQSALVMWPIHAYGSEAQKERWLPPLADGDVLGCFALTEPEHGSDAGSLETSAAVEGDGYRISGRKTWISSSPVADVALVWAKDRSRDGDPIRGFLVETDRAGVDVTKLDGKLSMRVSVTGEVGLNDVYVPEENVLPGVEGLKGPLSCNTEARYGLAWGSVGVARDCFETARDYATDREQFGKPIAGFQLQQEKLAEMATQITTAHLLAHRLADLKERGDLRHQQVSMAKRNNVRMARDQARVAREMLGGNGITTDYSPMRHMSNMETVYTYEGTHDIHSLILGEDLTGESAFV
ncbi:acyl-CoA dehydrogenase family protein [Salinirarus marinus]|uniref:acyl-CoA dehydrogenase family protein n=1 Tax=Salinirarus marinus TaxID=3068310 RepID=UPI003C6C230C